MAMGRRCLLDVELYEKRLEYPVNITTPNAKIAQIILSQYGGPDGEIGASMRYLSQRFTASNRTAMAVLTDVGTEELAHLEMVATIVHQLTRNLSSEELEKAGFAPYYADHTVGIWPQSAGGYPFSASELQSTGDPVADLFEDLAAEQKARLTYDKIPAAGEGSGGGRSDPVFEGSRDRAFPAVWRGTACNTGTAGDPEFLCLQRPLVSCPPCAK